ncbi:MAG: RNA methyltransferase [Bacteroidota bacterium]
MKKLSTSDLNRINIDEFKNTKKIPLVVVLENVRSLNNIGSVYRSADAFVIEEVILCGITACPPNKEIHKTALGATESVDWRYFNEIDEAIADLKNKGYLILSVEQAENSCLLNEFEIEKSKKYAIILGNEVDGVEQETIDKSDCCIEIPQLGTKHSLNVSVCAGIVMWHFFQKLI